MSAITATLDLEDDMTTVVTNLLRQFPKGSRVKLAISEVPPATPVPSLDEYRQMIAAARQKAPRGPWATTAEAMMVLREGEEDANGVGGRYLTGGGLGHGRSAL
jgi:hypothetical protein